MKKRVSKQISKVICAVSLIGVLCLGNSISSEAVNVTKSNSRVSGTMSLTRNTSAGTISNGKYVSHKYLPVVGSFACSSKKVSWQKTNKIYKLTLSGVVMIYADKDGAYRETFVLENFK